jgi:hypothetical protein
MYPRDATKYTTLTEQLERSERKFETDAAPGGPHKVGTLVFE